MDLFLLKKIATILIMPLSIILLLLLIALIVKNSKPKLSSKCLVLSITLLILCSLPPVSDKYMLTLEEQYHSYEQLDLPVDYIVVLGCRHTSSLGLPPTNELATCSLQRTIEAFRLFKLHPEARIVTSGYSGVDEVSNAEKVKQALVLLGVPEHKVITENFPKDTQEEAQLIAPRIQDTRTILVTNANHMLRAIGYFHAQQVYPIAAPTGHWVKQSDNPKGWAYFIPSIHKLQQTTLAWYETVGLIVQWIKTLFG